MERRQFQGVLIGLRPAVAKEQMIIVIPADPPQFLRQSVLQAIQYGIGVESEFPGLLPDRLHIMRMAMPDTDDGMPAVQVQVLLPFGIP